MKEEIINKIEEEIESKTIITDEIKESGYTTIEEVKSHLENYYM